MAEKSFLIPVAPKPWPKASREYPITPRENILLALSHKKPRWMPNLQASSQLYLSSIIRDIPTERTQDAADWFGVEYLYSEAQCSSTPQGNVLNDITEWEEKIVWPELDILDWAADAKKLERDESLALSMVMSNGPFQRLFGLEGFEQALIDLITEPDAVRAFMTKYAEFQINVMDRVREHLQLDYIVVADDWGTMRAPFFSTDTFEKTILEPTKLLANAVKARGIKIIAHCCGMVMPFVPYMVEEIGYDALDIQDAINDLPGVLAKYGKRITVECHSSAKIVHDPEMTEDKVRKYAHVLVDTLGAHAVPGAGAVASISSSFENIYYALENELYEYSLKQYSGLR